MKTSDLSGSALDWAVARCEVGEAAEQAGDWWKPSTDWAQGGPIIERERIETFIRDEEWYSYSSLSLPMDFHGDTPLIAAMRCYVASKLGDEVEIPEELV